MLYELCQLIFSCLWGLTIYLSIYLFWPFIFFYSLKDGEGRRRCRSNFVKPVPCVISGLLHWVLRNCQGRLLFSELFAMFLILAYLLFMLSFTLGSLMENCI